MNPWHMTSEGLFKMRNNALISVIVPVYNVKEYLNKCLESIIYQTYSNLEILIVDDGSTDGSENICEMYARKDIRVRVFHQQHKGLSEARNLALKYASGEYVACVDGDDYIEKDMYESLVENMDDEIDIVTCGVNNLFPKSINMKNYVSYKTHVRTKYNNYEAVRELIGGNAISFSSCDKLFRHYLFDGIWYPSGKVCEDLPVIYTLIRRSRNVVNIGKAKYNYVYRENSISRRSFYKGKLNFAIFAKDIAVDIRERYPDLTKEAMAFYFNNVVVVLENILNSSNCDDFNKIEKKLRKIILKNVINILRNPFISHERKQYYLRIASETNSCVGHILKIVVN